MHCTISTAVTESPNSGGSSVIINGTFSNDTGNITTPTGATTEPLPAYNPYWWQGIAFFLKNLFIFMRYTCRNECETVLLQQVHYMNYCTRA